jgi:hypothetical protein
VQHGHDHLLSQFTCEGGYYTTIYIKKLIPPPANARGAATILIKEKESPCKTWGGGHDVAAVVPGAIIVVAIPSSLSCSISIVAARFTPRAVAGWWPSSSSSSHHHCGCRAVGVLGRPVVPVCIGFPASIVVVVVVASLSRSVVVIVAVPSLSLFCLLLAPRVHPTSSRS